MDADAMGVDANERNRKPDKFKLSGPRVWLPIDMLEGAAYTGLSLSAKALLTDLASQLRARKGEIINNGDLTTALKVLKPKGWKSDVTIKRAADKLEEAGLIIKTRQGHLPNTCNLYAVTWLPLNESDKLDINARGFPFKGYKLKDPPPKINI